MELERELSAKALSTSRTSQWGQKVRAMQLRIKNRFCVAMTFQRLLKQKSRRLGLTLVSEHPTLQATTKGFVFARVFQGNVIFAKMIHNLAKHERQKRVEWISSIRVLAKFPLSISSRFWSLLGYSTRRGTLEIVEQEQHPPVHGEALVLIPLEGSTYGSKYEEGRVAVKEGAKRSQAAYYEGTFFKLLLP